ncbi:hypothetical protein GH714_007506 [Hevea brasiliensis]|uniref:Uncharacterized protein n=1 Tax=Hevea brasiliensis TaxID=3981 RepID=A0A6A6MX64_HEVBR|nr:hypothetical protein GH714_007506 [Hevea brasiliensis]
MFDGKPLGSLLAYINGDHEYILFEPHGKEANELGTIKQEAVPDLEEAGKFGYASIYGELPEFNLKRTQTSAVVPFVPSEKLLETMFSGSSHNLPPLTKLCSAFLESLLEKRITVSD